MNVVTNPNKVRPSLGRLSYLHPAEALRSGSAFDEPAASATRIMQNDYNRKPDGVINPGGETDQMLARVVAPMGAIRPAILSSSAQPNPANNTNATNRSGQKGPIGRLGEAIEERWDNQQKKRKGSVQSIGAALRLRPDGGPKTGARLS